MRKIFVLIFLAYFLLSFHLKGETIVNIHGFLSTARSMRIVKHVLCHSGYDVLLWEYPSRKKCIQEHAQRLVKVLQALASQNPDEPITFVTHSIGALVLRAALNTPGCPAEAKMGRAVLIAPPNQGSALARSMQSCFPLSFIMGNQTGKEILYFFPHQITRNFGEFPSSMNVLVIAGTRGCHTFKESNDGVVTVKETYLNTPFYFTSFPYSHGALLKRSASLRCMKTFITESSKSDFFNK